ncbi:hypothetical protein LshimejAT787_1901010 [Lyophyllum shimeji]|uniref:Cellobiose dehydrogenase cytochrome domain-containing protein n=1 Tax=Lyophyllum shimeji TaxID=47721 RepID=A0A9P3UTX6_LYOSH|nr:hypothetical protein LshimejAT787_1901010 [Lyophyllum shimeji]
MIASKVVALVAFAVSVHAASVGGFNTTSADFVPFLAMGQVAAVELFGSRNTQTRLIAQDLNGAIAQYGIVNGPFTTGQTQFGSILVPATEDILHGTPIAFTAIGNADQGFHVYFLSSSNRLREYKWTATVGGRYGSGTQCPECIDNMGYTVATGSNQWLYALENPTTNVLRVGFVSPGIPGTIVEAVKVNDASPWQLAPLPN